MNNRKEELNRRKNIKEEKMRCRDGEDEKRDKDA